MKVIDGYTGQMSDLSIKLNSLINEFPDEQKQEALVVVADTLQAELVTNEYSEKIPHASSLELIMRAVCGALKGRDEVDPGWKGYLLKKLDLGVELLKRSLSKSI